MTKYILALMLHIYHNKNDAQPSFQIVEMMGEQWIQKYEWRNSRDLKSYHISICIKQIHIHISKLFIVHEYGL